MILRYDFDKSDDNYETFDYEIETYEVEDFLNTQKKENNKDIFKSIISEVFYNAKETDADYVEYLEEEYGIKNYKDIDRLVDTDINQANELAKEMISNENDLEKLFDSCGALQDLKDCFEEEAYENYSDGVEYRKDPYSYNGYSRSDFF